MPLPGTPSDEVANIVDNGNGDITTVFVSMATRHPRELTPSICSGTPSTTGPSSTGSVRCGRRCGSCRHRSAARPAQ